MRVPGLPPRWRALMCCRLRGPVDVAGDNGTAGQSHRPAESFPPETFSCQSALHRHWRNRDQLLRTMADCDLDADAQQLGGMAGEQGRPVRSGGRNIEAHCREPRDLPEGRTARRRGSDQQLAENIGKQIRPHGRKEPGTANNCTLFIQCNDMKRVIAIELIEFEKPGIGELPAERIDEDPPPVDAERLVQPRFKLAARATHVLNVIGTHLAVAARLVVDELPAPHDNPRCSEVVSIVECRGATCLLRTFGGRPRSMTSDAHLWRSALERGRLDQELSRGR